MDASTLDDAGVFALGRGTALVQTVDFFTPIVDDPYDFGRIAAANSLSDVYAMGGTPLTALAVLCVPDDLASTEVVGEILRGGQETMRLAGCSILGGHSVRDPELKFGYAVTGQVARKRLLTNAGARAGDVLVLTKPLGTGILSTALKRGLLAAPLVRRLTRQLATLNRAAAEAAVAHGARAATDVTGFGFLGHATQMAEASGVTFRLRPDAGWFLPRVLELAGQGVVPGGLKRNVDHYAPRIDAGPVAPAMLEALHDPQTSGGLLVSVPARHADAFVRALTRRRVPVIHAGEVGRRGAHAIVLAPSPAKRTRRPATP